MNPATAARLIYDDEVRELLTKAREEVFREFSMTNPADPAALTACRLKLEGIDWFQGRLNSLAHDFTKRSTKE